MAGLLEEVAWAVAIHFRIYSLALPLLKTCHALTQLPLLGVSRYHGLCASEIATVYLMAGNREQASLWADKVAPLMLKKKNMEFQTMGRTGGVYYELGDIEKAKKFLLASVNEYKIPRDFASFVLRGLITSENSELQAINFDKLAAIELKAGNLSEAEKLFSKSFKQRQDTWYCRDTAEAYRANTAASIALAKGDEASAIEALLERASDALPSVMRLPCQLEVASAILENVSRLPSDTAKICADKILQLCRGRLDKNQQRRLGKA